MKLLFKNSIIFCVIGLLLGEAISRIFHTTSDIPSREIDKNNIQKYKPNQTGYWIGGTHDWIINEDGWPGNLPKSKEKLYTIIGDSYVENFMNPDSCRQSMVLKQKLPNYNFYEASRSGVSFIEAMQIASKLDSLKPIRQLIYVHDGDFLESITQLNKIQDITQYDSKENKIIPGILKSPGLKKILYNWKFLYYIYSNHLFASKEVKVNMPIQNINKEKILTKKQKEELYYLISFSSKNYKTDNLTLVYRPNPNSEIISLLKNFNFDVLLLTDNKEQKWSFDHDPHWTCIGHYEAATQVAKYFSTN